MQLLQSEIFCNFLNIFRFFRVLKTQISGILKCTPEIGMYEIISPRSPGSPWDMPSRKCRRKCTWMQDSQAS